MAGWSTHGPLTVQLKPRTVRSARTQKHTVPAQTQFSLRGRSGLLARTVREGRQRQGANRLLWQSRGRSTDHRDDIFAPFQKNLYFENRSDVIPHGNATVYALRGTKFYTDQVHWPLLIVRLSILLIRSISSLNTCWPAKTKPIFYLCLCLIYNQWL
jgi:hypothetical protein